MTWTLILGLTFAITGYETRDECLVAGKTQQPWGNAPNYVCVQTPPNAKIIGAHR